MKTKIDFNKEKMKTIKILFLITAFFYNFYYTKAENLDVKANIDSWKYNFAIEVNLIATEKNSKIFYYTDWEWRMDKIIEFKSPILIKENTTLNFYAIWENFSETKIKENTYTFDYPKDIELSYKNKEIFIKNTSNEVLNLWYFKVEWDNLQYEIYKDTFVEKWESFKLNYEWKDLEVLKLISPDNKIINSFTIKNEIELKQTTEKINDIKKQDDENISNNEEEVETWATVNEESLPKIDESLESFADFSTWIVEKNIETINFPENINEVKKEESDFNINNEIKWSVINKKENNTYLILSAFVWVIIIVSFYNIFFVINNYRKQRKKIQN